MTPGDLVAFIEADKRNESRRWDRVAWMTAKLLNVNLAKGKKPLTAEDLLGRPMTDSKKRVAKKRTKDEVERERHYLKGLDL